MSDIELLRDALDHIARVAQQGLNPTRRLDWITLRAKVALRGQEWSEDIREEPRDSVAELIKKNERLRARIRELSGDQSDSASSGPDQSDMNKG